MIGQKIKNYSSFNFFGPENLEKYRSTELYDALLEGSTIFFYRSSTSRTSLVRSGLAEFKYAFFSRTGRNAKKFRHSNQVWTVVNRCEQVWTGVNRCEQVGSGRKSFDQVFIPALRRSYQNRCEVLFFLEGESHDSQIWPTLRQSYTISTLSKSP